MQTNGYLHHVHYFRGFAILNIVAIHAAAIAQWIPSYGYIDTTTAFSAINETLFHSATLYFSLISGLLFAAVLQSRGFGRFFRSKFFYVLVPYLVCSIVFTFQAWNIEGTGVIALQQDVGAYLDGLPRNLLLGEAQFTYWYIPVLLIILAFTPLLWTLVGHGGVRRHALWTVILAPLLVSRPEFIDGVSQVQPETLVYFLGAYAFGLHLGERLDEHLDRLAEYRGLLIAVVVMASVAILVLQMNGVKHFGFYSVQESLWYLQKMGAAVLVLIWFRGLQPQRVHWLSPIADAAFSIYFLHAFYMVLVAELLYSFLMDEAFQPWSLYVMTVAYFVSSLALSFATVFLFRTLFGSRSRLLIGN